jgi:hypothetical protein
MEVEHVAQVEHAA